MNKLRFMLDVKEIIHNKHKDPNKTKGQYP